MKVLIDYDLCMGDGNCAKVAPDVFGYDGDKTQGFVKTEAVPPDSEEAVRRAAVECATSAIVIE